MLVGLRYTDGTSKSALKIADDDGARIAYRYGGWTIPISWFLLELIPNGQTLDISFSSGIHEQARLW